MRKFTLLFSLFVAIATTAMSQITSVDQLSNYKCYTIVSSDETRGGFYALDSKVDMCGVTGHNTGSDACHSVARNSSDTNQQFAIIQYNEEYYIYSVSKKKFLCDNGNVNKLADDQADYVVIEKQANGFSLFLNGNNYITASPGWCANTTANRGTCLQTTLTSQSSNDGWDAGAWYTITEADDFNPAEALDFLNPAMNEAEKEAAKALIDAIPTGVGYPTEEARDAYRAAVGSATYATEVETIKAEMLADASNYQMPVDGQAYYIKAKYNDGNYRYIYDDGTKIQMTDTKPTDFSGTFVFRKIDDEGRYALVNNDGEYMVFYSSGNAGAGWVNNGLSNKYKYENGDKAELKFIPGPLVECTNPNTIDETTEFMGCFAIQGWMYDPNNGNHSGDHYLMAGDPDFHNSGTSAFYYQDGNRSSAFMLEEAEYSNKPVMTDITSSSLVTVNGNSMATFSAPFATVVPEGVTAYIATAKSENVVTIEAVEGAVPANTGVILVGNAAGAVTMKPATDETLAVVTDNILGHSAKAAKALEANSCYILADGDNGIGFYATEAGNLPMNKAYLNIAAGASLSVEIRVPGTTAVEKVEMRNEKEEIFDLQGRRINEITCPGIYIVNGKKVLVK